MISCCLSCAKQELQQPVEVHQKQTLAPTERQLAQDKTDTPETGAPPAVGPSPRTEAQQGKGATPEPPQGMRCLVKHFGGQPRLGENGWALELAGSQPLLWDDRKTKTFEERLGHPDLQDQLTTPYVVGPVVPVEKPNGDPGRVRVDALFRALYGADEASIRAELVEVDLFGASVSVHRLVAPHLKAVIERLRSTVQRDPQLARYFADPGGGFNFRVIKGTERASPHSFGIALDLNTKLTAYHLWTPEQPWHGPVPEAIVQAFEAEGFIWGGRWFHYDTMHFEYRPELFDPECRADAHLGRVGAPFQAMVAKAAASGARASLRK